MAISNLMSTTLPGSMMEKDKEKAKQKEGDDAMMMMMNLEC